MKSSVRVGVGPPMKYLKRKKIQRNGYDLETYHTFEMTNDDVKALYGVLYWLSQYAGNEIALGAGLTLKVGKPQVDEFAIKDIETKLRDVAVFHRLSSAEEVVIKKV